MITLQQWHFPTFCPLLKFIDRFTDSFYGPSETQRGSALLIFIQIIQCVIKQVRRGGAGQWRSFIDRNRATWSQVCPSRKWPPGGGRGWWWPEKSGPWRVSLSKRAAMVMLSESSHSFSSHPWVSLSDPNSFNPPCMNRNRHIHRYHRRSQLEQDQQETLLENS